MILWNKNFVGLEQELGSQRESYDKKLESLEQQLKEATAEDKIAKKDDIESLKIDFDQRVKEAEENSLKRWQMIPRSDFKACSVL